MSNLTRRIDRLEKRMRDLVTDAVYAGGQVGKATNSEDRNFWIERHTVNKAMADEVQSVADDLRLNYTRRAVLSESVE
jgi:hypothetical protein